MAAGESTVKFVDDVGSYDQNWAASSAVTVMSSRAVEEGLEKLPGEHNLQRL